MVVLRANSASAKSTELIVNTILSTQILRSMALLLLRRLLLLLLSTSTQTSALRRVVRRMLLLRLWSSVVVSGTGLLRLLLLEVRLLSLLSGLLLGLLRGALGLDRASDTVAESTEPA